MKLINKVKQCEGPGGTLERWLLDNNIMIKLYKDENYYHLSLNNPTQNLITKSIFDKFNHPYNDLVMEYGGIFPPKITMEHKYFEKFIELVEGLDPDQLEEDPFCG